MSKNSDFWRGGRLTGAMVTLESLLSVPAGIVTSPRSVDDHLCSAPITFTCSASGIPLPTIVWIRTFGNSTISIANGTIVVHGRQLTVSSSPGDSNTIVQSRLRESSVSREDQCLDFTLACRAENTLGNHTSGSIRQRCKLL